VTIGSVIDLDLSMGVWTGEDTEAPRVSLTADPLQMILGETVTLRLNASDNAGVTNKSLSVSKNPVTLIENQAVYTTGTPGAIPATATVGDAAGLSSSDSLTLTVIDSNDTTAPVVSLDEADCKDITSPYTINGAVSDESAFNYRLLYRRPEAPFSPLTT
jgi:hypothetical protein